MLLVIGIVTVVIGLLGLAVSAAPRNERWTISLPALPGHYERVTEAVLAGGSIALTFTADSPVTIYIFTDAQHTAFLQSGYAASVAQDTGTSGSLSADLPGGGTYYIEVTHASGYDTSTANGLLTVAVTGVAPAPFYVGVAGLLVGVLLVFAGMRFGSGAKKGSASGPHPMDYPPPYTAPSWPPYSMVPGTENVMNPYGAYMSLPQAAPQPSVFPPPVGMVPPAVPPGTGGILATVENRSAGDENVQVFVDGVPAVSLTIPAGRTGQAHLRAPAGPPPGRIVHVEIVTSSGGRGGQDVIVASETTVQLLMRIG